MEAQVENGRKLIRTVSLSLQTKEFDSVLNNLKTKTTELGGYVENSSISGNSYSYTTTRYASYTIRIPADKLNEFVDIVGELGNVTQENESVEDVTLQYVDVESHKKALETEQARLMELLSTAENMEDLLAIESKLSDIRYEIESYESQLRLLDNQIDYSTVHVEIFEVERMTDAGEKGFFQEQDSESEDEENIEYDEDGNEIENTDDADNESDESESDDGVEYDENGDPVDNAGASDDVEYDEYGNVIDSDNTVSPDDYESEQSSDSDSSSSSGSGSGSSVVDFATQFVGNPYVWGGTSLTGGADCSGFTQSVYANFGVSLPRTSYEQQYAGTEVSYADAQPGDLICYGGHVAIYMGNGRIVHASNSVDGIKISDNAAYRTIVSVRRLV